MTPMFTASGNAGGLGTCDVRHAVQHAHADGNLGCLRFGASCPQAVSRERLEAIHCVLHERAPMVPAVLLPFAAAESGDRIDRIVAPRRAERVRWPMSRAFARRNRRRCAACGDRGMTGFGVVGPVTADDIEQFVVRDLVQQFGQDGPVGDILMRHQRGTHLTGVRVEPEMHLASRATLRIAMLAHLPFALAVDLYAGAVDHQMNRLAVANDRQLNLKRLRTTARHGQGGESQLAQALREALQRAQRQAEHGLDAQQRLNQRGAVQTRTAARWLGVRYTCKGGFVDPHRDVTSVDQAGVVGRPVPDTVARLRLAILACVPAHLLEAKNRESTQEPELLTGALDRLLCVNVSTATCTSD